MKTNIKTISAIFILATIGFTNIKVVAGESKSIHSNTSFRMDHALFTEALLSDKDIFYSAEAFSDKDTQEEIERYLLEQRLIESAKVQSEFLDTAETLTAAGADQEIEKYANKQVSMQTAKTEK